MNYIIEKINENNAEDYARVNAIAWKQSYKGIVNNDFLNLINKEDEIQKSILKLKNNLSDKSNKGFILYLDNKAVGMMRIGSSRKEKYKNEGELRAIYLLDEVKHKGYGRILFERALKELKIIGYNNIIIACLKDNPSNKFYKHICGKLVYTNPFSIPNKQLE